jgi:hypothetical protein
VKRTSLDSSDCIGDSKTPADSHHEGTDHSAFDTSSISKTRRCFNFTVLRNGASGLVLPDAQDHDASTTHEEGTRSTRTEVDYCAVHRSPLLATQRRVSAAVLPAVKTAEPSSITLDAIMKALVAMEERAVKAEERALKTEKTQLAIANHLSKVKRKLLEHKEASRQALDDPSGELASRTPRWLSSFLRRALMLPAFSVTLLAGLFDDLRATWTTRTGAT